MVFRSVRRCECWLRLALPEIKLPHQPTSIGARPLPAPGWRRRWRPCAIPIGSCGSTPVNSHEEFERSTDRDAILAHLFDIEIIELIVEKGDEDCWMRLNFGEDGWHLVQHH